MPHDIASLLLALTVNMLTVAVALRAVMDRVNDAARHAQLGAAFQAVGWALLLGSTAIGPQGGWVDRGMSTLAMAGIGGGLACYARAYELWCGRSRGSRLPGWLALLVPLGYGLGFGFYEFRVAWSNGLLALQMGLVAATLARPPAVAVGRWRWLLVVVLVAQMVMTFWRGWLGAFFSEQMPSFLSPHPVNFMFALVANATTVLSLVGVLLAHRDEASRELERLASLDGLTGVLNRRAWMQQADTELSVSQRYGHPMAVLMLDMDHFKRINDTRGHAAGDRALQFVAAALQAALRTGDQVGRYGGEEFCVLMKHADHEAALAFDRRMRNYLAEAAPRELGHELSYSAGIAMVHGAEDTLAAMLKRADDRLYGAKAQGRSRTLDQDGVQLELV
ncbi:GGDEF domain-containing protein [Pelomonas sp. KK5]|uniref:GGDEF domain-containing protein n=1 Tax=Pelomonas sp. KK5 TaxID=1855730 RepID=UPI00097BCB74|nr:GGDEF domain-containing protein [Pelomonas sp. KK5]